MNETAPHPKRVINKARRGLRLHKVLGNNMQIFDGISVLEQVAQRQDYQKSGFTSFKFKLSRCHHNKYHDEDGRLCLTLYSENIPTLNICNIPSQYIHMYGIIQ